MIVSGWAACSGAVLLQIWWGEFITRKIQKLNMQYENITLLNVFFLHICILIARMIVSSWAACVGGVLLRIWSGLCIIAWIPPCGTVRPMTRTRQYLAVQFQSRLEKKDPFHQSQVAHGRCAGGDLVAELYGGVQLRSHLGHCVCTSLSDPATTGPSSPLRSTPTSWPWSSW